MSAPVKFFHRETIGTGNNCSISILIDAWLKEKLISSSRFECWGEMEVHTDCKDMGTRGCCGKMTLCNKCQGVGDISVMAHIISIS
jgi:hypothetical protein